MGDFYGSEIDYDRELDGYFTGTVGAPVFGEIGDDELFDNAFDITADNCNANCLDVDN